MQIAWTSHFMQRMLFGASRAYVNQLGKGEEYDYLKPLYGLGLLAENFDHESNHFYHHYKIVNVDKPHRELKGLQFVFIELQKFKPNSHAERKLQALWLRFMSEINENTTKIDPALLAVPEINEAVKLSEQAAYTQAELAAYDAYWDSVSTDKTLYAGRFQEGKDEKTIEIARNLLTQKVEIETIAIATGLSEAEIKQLNKNI
jgi:predicted transposase/invertase (TIGR01784 family)